MNIAQLIRLSAEMDSESFTTVYPSPALVFARDREPESLYDSQSDTQWGQVDMETTSRRGIPVLRERERPQVILAGADVIDADSKVVFLAKSSRNSLKEIVILGRQTRSDIIVPLKSVSKVHAIFSREGQDWTILDERSKNGTTLNGVEIERGRRTFVRDGDAIGIGRVLNASFRTPRGLFGLLAELRR